MLDRDELQDFLDACGRELDAADLDGLAARHTFPVCVVGDDTTLVLSSPSELRSLLASSARGRQERGVTGTELRLRGVEEITEHLAWADVLRTDVAEDGRELAAERRRYLLRVSGGSCLICVIVAAGPA